MSKLLPSDLLQILKEVVLATSDGGDPSMAKELYAMRSSLSASVTLDTPLQELGFDSMQMTWVLVRLEERLEIDTSSVSLFNLFTVGDLVRSLQPLVDERNA